MHVIISATEVPQTRLKQIISSQGEEVLALTDRYSYNICTALDDIIIINTNETAESGLRLGGCLH